ncbi:hypothetical protein BOTBODRAFT_382349 [Botryobasidium botryosum FD-172 SS1]|uniref:Uncharacterized protein n=1 Tax=Botryobasidium botryosum (strain FD-172 SS1) TaxID=930990 RepID=A0A067N863_BOTB1|nr:hypothetical protein BOTBODRAFT_382349 [Botryobasidium botryosum FD-172 SS1]
MHGDFIVEVAGFQERSLRAEFGCGFLSPFPSFIIAIALSLCEVLQERTHVHASRYHYEIMGEKRGRTDGRVGVREAFVLGILASMISPHPRGLLRRPIMLQVDSRAMVIVIDRVGSDFSNADIEKGGHPLSNREAAYLAKEQSAVVTGSQLSRR